MPRPSVWVVLGTTVAVLVTVLGASAQHFQRASESEFSILGEDEPGPDTFSEPPMIPWQRPPGPLRVGLQAGHYQNSELPDELSNLRERGGGTRGGGKAEWQVNLSIAEATAKLLEPHGIVVDIIPATVPTAYVADLFIAIHADGSTEPSVSGFKVASPRRDRSGKGAELVALFEGVYGEATGLRLDPNVTRNMRGYYAFNYRRYAHAIHPMTPAIILETGFLTNPSDQRLLISNPGRAAEAIADAVLTFLDVEPAASAGAEATP